jgi:CBS domain-containing protein
MKVRDVMTKDVAAVRPDDALRDVAMLLVGRRISGLPVVDADRRVLGVVSEADLVQKEAGAPARPKGILGWLDVESGEIRAKVAARTAGEAMTAPAITIDADAPIAEAAALMVEEGVKRLPVVDGDTLVGIVSRADLVRAFLRTDAEIATEIREQVVLGTFAIAPETVHVVVERGEVTLGGEVETPEAATLLAAFVERVPGVVAVRSRLTSRDDGRLTKRP